MRCVLSASTGCLSHAAESEEHHRDVSIAALGLALAMRSLVLVSSGRTLACMLPASANASRSVRHPHLADQIFIFCAALTVTRSSTCCSTVRSWARRCARCRQPGPGARQRHQHSRIIMWTWAISGALVAVAGVLLALQPNLTRKSDSCCCSAVCLRILAVSASHRSAHRWHDRRHGAGGRRHCPSQLHPHRLSRSGYKFSVAFVILILILLLRPRGCSETAMTGGSRRAACRKM